MGDGVPNNRVEVIDRFPFASDTNASDVGDLTVGRTATAGQSSTTHGYNTGGYTSSGQSTIMDKYSYGSSSNATDVGDLIMVLFAGHGVQD